MPVSAMESGVPVETGVDGRIFTPTDRWLQTLEDVRARERRLRALLPLDDGMELLRRFAGEDAGKHTPAGMSAERAARDLRERERVLQYLRSGAPVPRTLDDLLDLWTAATRTDARVYDDLPAHFRREGEHVPFSADGSVRPGWETVPPGAVPAENGALLAYIGTGALVLKDVNWIAVLSAGTFGFVTAMLLALTGLPEAPVEKQPPDDENA